MDFAKLFTVDGDKQLLCVLKASEDDGAPEIQVTTYVAGICVVFANRLVEVGAPIPHPEGLMARTQELFGSMNQDDAEDAYRMAIDFAARQAAGALDGLDVADASTLVLSADEVAPHEAAMPDVEFERPGAPRGWLDIPMTSIALH